MYGKWHVFVKRPTDIANLKKDLWFTWDNGLVSGQQIVQGKVRGSVFGFLPRKDTIALDNQGQRSKAITQAGHGDQGAIVNLFHKVLCCSGKHLQTVQDDLSDLIKKRN